MAMFTKTIIEEGISDLSEQDGQTIVGYTAWIKDETQPGKNGICIGASRSHTVQRCKTNFVDPLSAAVSTMKLCEKAIIEVHSMYVSTPDMLFPMNLPRSCHIAYEVEVLEIKYSLQDVARPISGEPPPSKRRRI